MEIDNKMTKVWNGSGIILASMVILVSFLYSSGYANGEQAILGMLVIVVFGLIYIGTQCMGITDELKWRNLNVGAKKKNDQG